MTDKTVDPNNVPQIHDKRTKPPGILPKNTQAWILTGIAVAMIAVIALSGKNSTPRASQPQSNAVVGSRPSCLSHPIRSCRPPNG